LFVYFFVSLSYVLNAQCCLCLWIDHQNENEKKRKINDPQHNTEPRMMNNIDTTKRLKVKPAE
jgi:hypothetical protein